jgi:hypothetical protein
VVDGAADDPADVTLTPPDDGEDSSDTTNITVGEHNVREINIPDGWLLTDGSCASDQPEGFVTANGGLPLLTFTARYGDDVVCTFVDNEQGGATRTQGFWATHTILTDTFWNGGELPPNTSGQLASWVPVIDSPDAYLCQPPTVIPLFAGVQITAIPAIGQNQVLGGFWAGVSQTRSTGNKKRTALDQARLQFLQQYLAAVLNVHAFGTPIPGTSLADARAAYCGTNIGAIQTQKSLLAAYNESGDTGEFTPGANATAKLSKSYADIAFWDITFH